MILEVGTLDSAGLDRGFDSKREDRDYDVEEQNLEKVEHRRKVVRWRIRQDVR